ncbi:hypothetical protein HID58_076039, partial [Brassica napus]
PSSRLTVLDHPPLSLRSCFIQRLHHHSRSLPSRSSSSVDIHTVPKRNDRSFHFINHLKRIVMIESVTLGRNLHVHVIGLSSSVFTNTISLHTSSTLFPRVSVPPETVATSIGVGAASIRSEESVAGGSDAKVSCRIPSTVIVPGL